MSLITQLCRLSNLTISNYKTVLQVRASWLNQVQICNYTRKTAEQKLGIERPKRPLTPFFKFMIQMRPEMLAKNPGISSKEAIAWISKHWQQLDEESKSQMKKEYQKDSEDYKKIKAMYDSSLTDEQKTDIKRVRNEMAAAKEKRKLKAEFIELGKPKKPMCSYFLYMQSRKDTFKGKQMKEYQATVKVDWQKLPESEKAKFDKQAMELMNKYRKDLEAWELKMISQGRSDLVRTKRVRVKKPTSAKKSQ